MPVAIVTGASSGIGLALSIHLIEKSWTVVLADLAPPPVSALTLSPGKSEFFKTDVTSWDNVAALFKHTFNTYSRLDFVAANAGIDDRDDVVAESAAEEPEPLNFKTIDVDLYGSLNTYWCSLHYMRRNPDGRHGKIVFTASSAGLYAFPSNPEYCAAKHGLMGFTRSVAQPLEKDKITVNAICPALVKTGLAPAELLRQIPQEQMTPMSTIMRAYDIFLDDEDYKVTGQTVECSLGDLFYRQQPDFASTSQKVMFGNEVNVWMDSYERT
ncbi:hypothetical protein BZA70DRAFT_105200 [Myxozyma melibiosi]|uniref:Uncharacterized protein n=1 Tax=Myxozyma melibiosi TaxID=54550 RepID=A0ABR1F9F1_9ASCO